MSKELNVVNFVNFSPKKIREFSAMEIKTLECYDENGTPVPGGIFDPKLSSTTERKHDHGIFGHIELAYPVVHVRYATMIFRLLSATCHNCGRILLNNEEIEEIRRLRDFNHFFNENISSSIIRKTLKMAQDHKWYGKCPSCGYLQKPIGFEKPTKFYERAEAPNDTNFKEVRDLLSPNMLRERLERLNEEDIQLLGFESKGARPEWMIIKVLPVPFVDIRRIGSEDARMFMDILRCNQRNKENTLDLNLEMLVKFEELVSELQNYITDYINEASQMINKGKDHRA